MDFSNLSKCEVCSLKGIKVFPYLPIDPLNRILIIGQAPGDTEIVTKSPFVGSAGKMLYACLKGAGVDKRRVFQTNLVLCHPGKDKKGNDLPPSPRDIYNCHLRLKAEIQEIKPDIIVSLGNVATYELTGKEGIQSLRGGIYPLREAFEYKCSVLACLHPSFVMRQRQWVEIAIKDFQEISKVLMGTTTEEKEYNFLYDPQYGELERYLYQNNNLLAFDSETTGLNVRKDKVIGMSFSNEYNSSAAILLTDNDPRLVLIKTVLEDESIKKVTQNGSYDCEIIFNSLGITVKGLQYDTRLAEQMMNPDLPTSLDHLRVVYTRIKPYKPHKKEMEQIAHWGKERMLLYANWDAVTTNQVMYEQKKIITPGQLNLLENLLIPLVPALNKMERKGVKVDINLLAGMFAQNLPKLKALEDDIHTRMGINPHSPKQVSEYFHIDGADKVLLNYYITRDDPRAEEMRLILEARDLKKQNSTYLKGLWDRLEDGYIHTQYLPDGTGTGRLSSRNPNLQNQPKPIRVLFTADTPQHYLVSADYRQLELWVGSILAPCPTLFNDLKMGVDVHNRVAMEMKPYVKESMQHRLRLLAKAVVFGTFYGRSARSIAIEHGCQVKEAEDWQRICFSSYPGLLKYIKDRFYDYNTTKVVTTPWGRHRVISTPTQAFNTPVQSSASDVTMSTLVEMDRAGFDLRLTVHDEIVFQCLEGELEEQIKKAKSIFERPIQQLNNTSFPVEFKFGKNWYEMEKFTI